MMEPKVISINTTRVNAIAVFADTSGFSTFARRTFDRPEIHREYLLSLYLRAHQYQTEFQCFLKKECDGVIFVHEYAEEPTSDQIVAVLKGVERFGRDMQEIVRLVPYPRPEGFRCRVTMGMSWKMTTIHEAPPDCPKAFCVALTEHDYWEYVTVLASRMLDAHKRTPLACCQLIREKVTGPEIGFEKLPEERRIPEGVFKEDMRDLWRFFLKPL